MRMFLVFIVAIIMAATVVPKAAAAARQPNIVLIVGDDMGFADVGFHGCTDIPTPRLDALAKSGVRFTNGYVTGPYCSPTRAGLLTGRYQNRFGHEFNVSADVQEGLPLTEVTLANHLKQAGYRTGLFGKWHLGGGDYHPQKRGFDDFFGFISGAHDYFKPAGILRGTMPAKTNGYLTDLLAHESVAFIEANKSKPFFLYLAFNAVHTPMQADDARLKKFANIANPTRRTYAAMMSALDDAVGAVVQKLAAEKLTHNTLIMFISDNGGPTMKGTTINASSNKPFRGSKRTTLEGGIRVPFLISWLGQLPEGKIDNRPVIQLDLFPTALAAANVAIQSDWKLDGVNLMPYLKDDATKLPHETLYWRFGKQMAVRHGDWKLVRYDQAVEGQVGLSPARLYNLKTDLGEETDLAAKHPEKVQELQALWDEWNKLNVPPRWGGIGPVK